MVELCWKCHGAGWIWAEELDEYHGDPSEISFDMTRYDCDTCDNVREEPKKKLFKAPALVWSGIGNSMGYTTTIHAQTPLGYYRLNQTHYDPPLWSANRNGFILGVDLNYEEAKGCCEKDWKRGVMEILKETVKVND